MTSWALPIFALLGAGCGAGVDLGSGTHSNHPSPVPLQIAGSVWASVSSAGLATNSVPATYSLPLNGGSNNFTGGEVTSFADTSNSTPARRVASAAFYIIADFCFNVSAIDLTPFHYLHVMGSAEGGIGTGSAVPVGSNYEVGAWNNTAGAYDGLSWTSATFNASAFDFRTSDSMRPTDAVKLGTGGEKCIFVSITSLGTGSGPNFSTIGLINLRAVLE
jgi:hypothetical protein